MNRLSFTSYESVEAVATLEEDWRRLHRECTYRSVFNSFDFFMASVTTPSDPDDTLYVLKASAEDDAVAIFPLQLSLLTIGGVRLRLLEYAAQEEIDKPYPLIRQGREELAWRGLAGFLSANRDRWHRLDLVEVREGLPAISQVPRYFRPPVYWVREQEDCPSPLVALDQPWDEFWKAHPKMRKKVKRMQKAFGERLRFEVQDQANAWRACLEAYVDLESRGWKAGRVGIGKDHWTLSLYRKLFSRLAARNKLYFGLMYLDHELVAAEVAYIEGTTVYFCHGTYDERYASYSPGMVSTCLFLRHFLGERFVDGDYLAGFAGYLKPWADRIVPSRRLIVYRISVPVLYAFAIKALSRIGARSRREKEAERHRCRMPAP